MNLGIQMILYVHTANFVNVKQMKSVVTYMQRHQEQNCNILACHCRTPNEALLLKKRKQILMYTYWSKKIT